MLDHRQLKSILAGRAMSQRSLARRLRINPATLSDYLRGARRAPGDLTERIETALRLPAGSIGTASKKAA